MGLVLLPIILLAALAACAPAAPALTWEDLPPGVAARGAVLFTQSINGAPPCAGCHPTGEARGQGPGLGSYRQVAGSRVAGESAEVYTLYSIIQPSRHVVRGFSNIMYNTYQERLGPQDIADLIAYLLTL